MTGVTIFCITVSLVLVLSFISCRETISCYVTLVSSKQSLHAYQVIVFVIVILSNENIQFFFLSRKGKLKNVEIHSVSIIDSTRFIIIMVFSLIVL